MISRRGAILGAYAFAVASDVANAAYPSLPDPMPVNPWGTYETIDIRLSKSNDYWFRLKHSDNYWAIHLNGQLLHCSNSDNGSVNKRFAISPFLKSGMNVLYFSGFNARPSGHGGNPWRFDWEFFQVIQSTGGAQEVAIVSRSVGTSGWTNWDIPATVMRLNIDSF